MAGPIKRAFYVVEHTPGNAFTVVNGTRIAIGQRRIGPFDRLSDAADWLSGTMHPHATYVIEEVATPW